MNLAIVTTKPITISSDLFESDPEDEARSFADSFTASKRASESKRKPGIANSAWLKICVSTETMKKTGDWSDARGTHLVALYEILHTQVYGIRPAELIPLERMRAAAMAGRMLTKEFGDEIDEAVEFIRWTWTDEVRQEKWRRDNDRPGRRIGWRLMFNGSLLSDWRLAVSRKRGK